MLDSVLYARDKYLNPDGLMVPSQTSILLSGYAGQPWYDDRVDFWNDVYGFDMQVMKDKIEDEAMIEVVDDGEVVSNEVSIAVSRAPPSLSSPTTKSALNAPGPPAGHLYSNCDDRLALVRVPLHPLDHASARVRPERDHLPSARPPRAL